jgi:hypothetical protein
MNGALPQIRIHESRSMVTVGLTWLFDVAEPVVANYRD